MASVTASVGEYTIRERVDYYFSGIVLLYILHELGHIAMYLLLGVNFRVVVGHQVPTVIGLPHLVGMVRVGTGDIWKEFLIVIVGPILMQLLYIIPFKKDRRWLLGLLISYADIIGFVMYYWM